MKTIEEAKEFLATHALDGAVCPCCSQYFKVYKRTINKTQALALVAFYKHAKVVGFDCFLHPIKDFSGSDVSFNIRSISGDWAKLRYWGLIQESESKLGRWRLTSRGVMFVDGIIDVPRFVFVLNKECIKIDHSEQLNISEILK